MHTISPEVLNKVRAAIHDEAQSTKKAGAQATKPKQQVDALQGGSKESPFFY
jgi:hypothetical protein